MNAFSRAVSSSLGHQPKIEDGIRGEALVLESNASIPLDHTERVTLGGWSRWVGDIALQVRVPGLPPTYLRPRRWLTRAKYPIAGTLLPITVDRADPSGIRIEWDEVAEIDDWIAGGHPVFTDPDSAQARVHDALRGRTGAAIQDGQRAAIDVATQVIGPGVALDPALVSRSVANAQRSSPTQPAVQRQPVSRPSGRILAVGYEDDGDGARAVRGEILLSVAAPGSFRYGLRWKGWIPRRKMVTLWWDVPVSIDPDNPRRLQIRWDEVAGIEVFTSALHSANDQLAAQLAAGPAQGIDAYRGLLSAIADPVQRAQVGQQLAHGLAGVPGGPATPAVTESTAAVTEPTVAAPDPLDQLKRLGELRASGALTEAEFAVEKARVLERM